MIRIFLHYLWVTLLLLLISLGYVVTETTAGLQLGIAIASLYLPGQLHIETLQGSLASTITCDNLHYEDKNVTLHIRHLKLDWDPLELLRQQVDIHALAMNDITVHLSDAASGQTSFDLSMLSKLLNHVKATNVTLNHVIVLQNQKTLLQLNQLALEENALRNQFALDGWVNHHPLRGHANLIFKPQGVMIDQAFFQVYDAMLRVQGNVTDQWHLLWDLTIPEMHRLTAETHGNLTVTGTVQGSYLTPMISASSQNTIPIPRLGIALQQMQLQIQTSSNLQLSYQGSFVSHKGKVLLEGSSQLAENTFPTKLSIVGTNVQVANLPEYKITVNPSLLLELTANSLLLKGGIHIPEADIKPKDFRTTLTLPSDVIIVGQPHKNPSALMAYAPSMQVSVTLGNKVHLRYQDFESSIRGGLILRKNPNTQLTAIGQLYAVNGTYKAYHQVLKILDGRLIYTGGLITNPGLNIKAVRQLRTVLTDNTNFMTGSGPSVYGGSQILTVGVQVLGTIDSPNISLISDPADLTQTAILSYLLFGVPEPLSGSQKMTLMDAASAFNMASTGVSPITSLTQHMQQTFGLNELQIGSVQSFDPSANQNNGGTVDNTSLILGKEISHNLYVHSSVSLFSPTPIYTINIQYKLGKHWSIQSETNTLDTGADLMYSIERE